MRKNDTFKYVFVPILFFQRSRTQRVDVPQASLLLPDSAHVGGEGVAGGAGIDAGSDFFKQGERVSDARYDRDGLFLTFHVGLTNLLDRVSTVTTFTCTWGHATVIIHRRVARLSLPESYVCFISAVVRSSDELRAIVHLRVARSLFSESKLFR